MKHLRVRIAAALLCIILLLSGISATAVRKSCAVLIRRTEAVLDTEHPGTEIEALTGEWRRQSILLHLFVPNQPLTDLNTAVLRLEWIRGRELSVF